MKVPQTRPQDTTVIHWEFMRGSARLSCQIDRSQTIDGQPQFAVALVPF